MAPSSYVFKGRDFRRCPIYQHTAPLTDIRRELSQIANFYRRLERCYNYSTVALILCVAAPVVLLFALPVLRELGWLIIAALSLASLGAGMMRSRARQWHFPRDRDRLFHDVLSLLSRDIAPGAALDVQLCFGSLAQTGQASEPQRSGPGPIAQDSRSPDLHSPDPRNHTARSHSPAHPVENWRNLWFTIQGGFLDGNRFKLHLAERVRVTTSTQSLPNPQQSLKNTSTESRCDGFDLSLQLQVDPNHYGSLTPFQPHLAGAVKLLPGAVLVRHHSAQQDLYFAVSLPPAFTASLMYQSIVLLFLSAYHVLHLAAQLDAATPVVRALGASTAPAVGWPEPLERSKEHGRQQLFQEESNQR